MIDTPFAHSVTPREKLRADLPFRAALWIAALIVLGFFLIFNFGVFSKGIGALDISYWMTEPESSGRAGGVSSILVSTILILFVALSISVPISVGTAVFLSEFAPRRTRIGHWIGLSLDVLASVPSIVFGLFGNAIFCKFFGLGFSILAGALTLACMVFPILIRSVEESLRAAPDEYRMGAEALAFSRTTTVFHILLPQALPGVFAGVVLGIGRCLGETAALLFTSGYVDRMPESVMDSGRSLSIHIYDLAMNVAGGEANAYKSAFVLLTLIFAVNSIVAIIGKTWIGRSQGNS